MSSAVLAGRYQLAERIGVGGMAEVFRGEDLALERPVAVKMLHPAADALGHARERLRSEVRLLARLSHPGLVPVYDTGEEGGRAFLVMQLVDGGTLADRLAGGSIPPDDVRRIGAELADVLAYLHGRDLIHRDLKPSNVLVASTGRISLTDFGIARALDDVHLTATNTPIGTAAYMAPEQVQGGHAGMPADVYSLGLILIECLDGAPAYRGSNAFDVAAARLHEQPHIPEVDLGMPFAGLLEAMTSRDPDRRPTAQEITARFQEISPASAPPLGPEGTAVLPLVASTQERLPSPPQRFADKLGSLRHQLSAGMPTWFGVRADLAVGLGLAVVGVVLTLALVAGGGGERPAENVGPGRNMTPTAPPGPARLPADLDRLDKAVSPDDR